jgi:hypothetical protein
MRDWASALNFLFVISLYGTPIAFLASCIGVGLARPVGILVSVMSLFSCMAELGAVTGGPF